MSRYLLQKCHIRDGEFVSSKDTPQEFDWKQLHERFAPSGRREELMKLRLLRHHAYVGLTNGRHGTLNFVLVNPDMSGRIDWILSKDSSFEGRLIEVFRVEELDLDFSLVEEAGRCA